MNATESYLGKFVGKSLGHEIDSSAGTALVDTEVMLCSDSPLKRVGSGEIQKYCQLLNWSQMS